MWNKQTKQKKLIRNLYIGGSVSLTTSNPWVQPEIDVNLLATNYDIYCMKEAAKISHEFLKAPSLAGFVLRPFGGWSIFSPSLPA